ncbi:PASTA domain-containing protein [Actinoplanes sp. NPDC051513]|uniref:PASTA domain-containing protein n=1 Tax=Actinoplanes sp. NPDC051513 TaxID=3363908 RepID=UPI0037A76DF5
MSDESDETRRVPPVDDSTIPGKRLDDTLADDDADVAPARDDDATRVAPAASPASSPGDDATRVAPAASSAAEDDDWASSRAKPVWSGRAEVRSPRPGQTIYDTDWSDGPAAAPGQRDRWWMPIVAGIIVLILLGVLAWAIYVIVQNAGDEQTPATTPSTVVATTNPPPSTAPSTALSTAPTTTVPTTTATTQQPTTSVTVPALKGLPLADARAALNRMGLRYRVLYVTNTAAPGTVIDSDPAEGQEVPPDTRITIVVAQEGPVTATPTTTATATG